MPDKTSDKSFDKASGLLVAVDVGRSAVKVAYCLRGKEAVTFSFGSAFSFGFDALSGFGSTFVNLSLDKQVLCLTLPESSSNELIRAGFCSIKSDPSKEVSVLFGYTADKEGSSHRISVTEGRLFHEVALFAIWYSVARVVRTLGYKGSVDVAINLTFENGAFSSFYSKWLHGTHSVYLWEVVNKGSRTRVPVTFNVGRVLCLQQGYGALFNCLSGREDDLSVLRQSTGFVVDVGRYTVDLSLVKSLTLVRGRSFAGGVDSLVKRVQSALLAEGINLSDSEVEDALKRQVSVSDVHGHTINPYKLMVEKGFDVQFYQLVRQFIENFLVGDSLNYMVLVGGGCYLLESFLSEDFKLPLIHVDYTYGNALGMLRLLAA